MISTQMTERPSVNMPIDRFLMKLQQIKQLKVAGGSTHGSAHRGDEIAYSYTFIALISGQGNLSIGDRNFRMRQDKVYVCLPGQHFNIEAASQEAVDVYLIRFDMYEEPETVSPQLRRVCEDELFCGVQEVTLYPAGQVLLFCGKIAEYRENEDELERYLGQLLFQKMVYLMLRAPRLQLEDSQMALERTKAYIEHHYEENLTIEQLARMAEISPKYYVDLFKKTYGISSMDYVTKLRINRAKQLLAGSDSLLKDIAHQVGYSDEFYFSRKFKKEVGMSPTSYIKSCRM